MSNLSDLIGDANLYGGVNYSFTYDRFCTANEAIYFNQGFLQVPSGVYFLGDFTVTTWAYLKSYQSYSRIFDFGNGPNNDNVILAVMDKTSKINAFIFQATIISFFETIFSIINLSQWYFLSFVLNGTTGYIYLNGNQIASNQLLIPNNIIRTNNFIGKSNQLNDSNADAIYDEIKIYQGALTSTEIMNEYNISSNNGNI